MRLIQASWVPVAFILSVAPASASEITLSGYANGCFFSDNDGSCSPVMAQQSSTFRTHELFYANGAFSGTTVGGQLPLTLGAFSLVPRGNDTYAGHYFNLRVTFDIPVGVQAHSAVFSSVLTGITSSAPGQCGPAGAPCGSVTIDFDNTPIPFTFANGTSTGSFLLTILDLTLAAGQRHATLGGMITAAQETHTPTSVPEPGALMFVGVAIAGLVARARRANRIQGGEHLGA